MKAAATAMLAVIVIFTAIYFIPLLSAPESAILTVVALTIFFGFVIFSGVPTSWWKYPAALLVASLVASTYYHSVLCAMCAGLNLGYIDYLFSKRVQ